MKGLVLNVPVLNTYFHFCGRVYECKLVFIVLISQKWCWKSVHIDASKACHQKSLPSKDQRQKIATNDDLSILSSKSLGLCALSIC